MYTLGAKNVHMAMSMVISTRIHILVSTTITVTRIPTIMMNTKAILTTMTTRKNNILAHMSIMHKSTIMIRRIKVRNRDNLSETSMLHFKVSELPYLKPMRKKLSLYSLNQKLRWSWKKSM